VERKHEFFIYKLIRWFGNICKSSSVFIKKTVIKWVRYQRWELYRIIVREKKSWNFHKID
jgi:hypothetical protein